MKPITVGEFRRRQRMAWRHLGRQNPPAPPMRQGGQRAKAQAPTSPTNDADSACPSRLGRYLRFSGDYYRPLGGAYDLRDTFDTIEEAQAAANNELKDGRWSHILDSETGRLWEAPQGSDPEWSDWGWDAWNFPTVPLVPQPQERL